MKSKPIGPDGYVYGEWTSLDMTCFTKAERRGLPASQAQSVWIKFYRNGRYTVVDQTGFTFRAYRSELSAPKQQRVAE